MAGMKVYLAGPMTGVEDHNFPAFHKASDYLRELGFEVISPAELDDGDTSQSWQHYMKRDIALLVECDGVAVLPGWQKSRGARIEVFLATTLGLQVIDALFPADHVFPDLHLAGSEYDEEEDGGSILEEAEKLVSGPRGDDYGHPIQDFTRTGRMWAAILGLDEVGPEKVALCMTALKLSRETNRPKRDNRVDAAGYMKCLDMIETYGGS